MNSLVAEVVLIGVVLASSIMVGGFTFGLIGVYVPPAEVAVQVASCSSANSSLDCNLMVVNVGAKNVDASGCSINAAGVEVSGALRGVTTIPASSQIQMSCSVNGLSAMPGATVVGSLYMSNGGVAYFTSSTS